MAEPIAKQIIDAIRARLESIIVEDGFNFEPKVLEIGGQPALLSEDLINGSVVSVFEQPDEPGEAVISGAQVVTQRIVIEGAAVYTGYSENESLYLLWQDICRAVFTSDTTLSGLAVSVSRGPKVFVYSQTGEGITGVRQVVNVQYFETYGNP